MFPSQWENEKISDEEDDFKNNPPSVVCANHRVILFFDVDCFEVQLWMNKLRPELVGKDVPVVVINPDRIIVSVNYTAKSVGVKRGLGRRSLIDACLLCEKAGTKLVEIIVPERYGKVDSFLPLVEGNRILKAIFSFPQFQNRLSSIRAERNCRDELYIDVTHLIKEKFTSYNKTSVHRNAVSIPSQVEVNSLIQRKIHANVKYNGKAATVMEGRKGKITGQELSYRIQQVYPRQIESYHLDELRLVHGAIMANLIIQHVKSQTGYKVSAGVGHSKLVAKLASDLNKPNGISIITDISLPRLSKSIPFQDLFGFGGNIGEAVRELFLKQGLSVKYVHDVTRATNGDLNYLIDSFAQLNYVDSQTKAKDLHNKCQFKDESEVTLSAHPDTISTVLSFKGCKQSDPFERKILNISKDMKSRINYCKKELGMIAKKLVVKVEMENDPGVTPRPRDSSVPNNTMSLPEETNQFVSPGSIYKFIFDYIQNNGLNSIGITFRKFV